MSVPPESANSPKTPAVVARLKDVSLHYGKTLALDNISLDIPANCMIGVIGPDGVGKSTLFSLISGAHRIQQGRIEVLGGDMADARHRTSVCPRIAYMPQGLGKNLYPTLSVSENIDFFGSLFGQSKAEREARIEQLLKSTGLARFGNRPAGKLSGGMKQKVGLCCALIHDPDFLILDEPTTGVDPLSRRQFWELIDRIRAANPGMSVIVSTAYMEEAARFDWLIAMNAGRVLATGTPKEFLSRTGAADLDAAFIKMLPEEMTRDYRPVEIPPRTGAATSDIAIEADGLTMRFGNFVAVDHVSFRIGKGEIFGFLGSNGCGKTTTMKMMTGLLTPSEGTAKLFGHVLDPSNIEVRRHIGYMSQAFSLYTELSVRQNLDLHARLFGLSAEKIPARIDEVVRQFGLATVMEAMPDALPLGIRQRLSLAVAMIHSPQILILDEPTSGVDPVARDDFWRVLLDLSRRDNVTIFVSTHFMNEAERCDRISLMNAGKVLVSDTPKNIIASRQAVTLEEAFIRYLEDAGAREGEPEAGSIAARVRDTGEAHVTRLGEFFNLRRMLCLARREGIELLRDPVRMALALVGSVILMFVVATGINLDVDNLSFAVLDRDQTVASENYALNIFGSHYFIQKPAITDYDDLDHRMRSGDISLAIEIPPHFARDVEAGRNVKIAAWIDGAMPERGETIRTYVQSIHLGWLNEWRRTHNSHLRDPFQIQLRYRYNPGVLSLVAITPAVIPLLLILIPSILSALSVVREKELGSIINFYVTPATPLEFLLGKQAPYIVLSMGSFLLLFLFAVLVLRVPFTGSFFTLALGAFVYVAVATALGLFISSFITSQVAAIVGTAILTLIPAINYCGLTTPVSSIEGPAKLIGRFFPTTYFMIIARGTFSKGLALWDLVPSFIPLVISVILLLTASTMLLKKQAG